VKVRIPQTPSNLPRSIFAMPPILTAAETGGRGVATLRACTDALTSANYAADFVVVSRPSRLEIAPRRGAAEVRLACSPTNKPSRRRSLLQRSA
jgi:hypothetical protein